MSRSNSETESESPSVEQLIQSASNDKAAKLRRSRKREQWLGEIAKGLLPAHINDRIDVVLSANISTAFVMPADVQTLVGQDKIDRAEAERMANSVDGDYLIAVTTESADTNRLPISDQKTADISVQTGLVIHEILHVLKTDFNNIGRISDCVCDQYEDYANDLFNFVEDGAIENEARTGDQFTEKIRTRINIINQALTETIDDYRAAAADPNTNSPVRTLTGKEAVSRAFYDELDWDSKVTDALISDGDEPIKLADHVPEDEFEALTDKITRFKHNIFTIRSDDTDSIFTNDKQQGNVRITEFIAFWNQVVEPFIDKLPEDKEQEIKNQRGRQQQSEGTQSGDTDADIKQVQQIQQIPDIDDSSSNSQSGGQQSQQSQPDPADYSDGSDGPKNRNKDKSTNTSSDEQDASEGHNDSTNGSQQTLVEALEQNSSSTNEQSGPETETENSNEGSGSTNSGSNPSDPDNNGDRQEAHNTDGHGDIEKDDFDKDRKIAQQQEREVTIDEQAVAQDLNQLVNPPGNSAGDGSLSINNIEILPDSKRSRNTNVWNRIQENYQRTANTLERVLELEEPDDTRGGVVAGAGVDTSSVYRSSYNDPRYMSRPTQGERKRYLIVLVLDRSGSMSGDEKITSAVESLGQFTLACEELGIDVAVIDFVDNKPRYIKTPHVRPQAVKNTLSSKRTGGGTPLGDSLEIATKIASRSPKQSMIISVTDGKPSDLDTIESMINTYNIPLYSLLINIDSNISNKQQQYLTLIENSQNVAPSMTEVIDDTETLAETVDEMASNLI